jgi:hypothetical protein
MGNDIKFKKNYLAKCIVVCRDQGCMGVSVRMMNHLKLDNFNPNTLVGGDIRILL